MAEQESASNVIPSSKVSAEKQIDILKAFAIFYAKNQTGATYTDVAAILDADKTNVSSTLKFWKDVGMLISERGKYVPSERLKDFNQRIQWGDNAEAWKLFQRGIEQSWFITQLRMRFKLKATANREELTRLLGVGSSAASSDKGAQKSIAILLDLLELSGILVGDKEGNYSIVSDGKGMNRELNVTNSGEMVQVRIDHQQYAIETRKLKEFITSNGKKTDGSVQELD